MLKSATSTSAAEAGAAAPTRERKYRPLRISLLGCEGAGKTCFLAGLAILGEPNRHTSITLSPTDPLTVDYLDELARTLRAQQWPPPTSMTTILNMRIGLDGQAIDVLLVDYPGEDFRNELRKLKHDEIEALYQHYSQSDATLLLFDPDRDVRGSADPQDRELQIERQMAHLQAIAEVWAERSHQAASQTERDRRLRSVDVAIVLTKSDRVPGLTTGAAARTFFQRYARALDRKIRQQADVVEYFPLSAVGATGTQSGVGADALARESSPVIQTMPAGDLNPTGYEAIFAWVLKRRRWRRIRRPLGVAAALVGVVLIAGLGWMGWRWAEQSGELAILDDARLSRVEKLEHTESTSAASVIQQRSQVVADEINSLTKNLAAASNDAAIDEVVQKAERLSSLRPGAMQSRIDSLIHDARQKKEDMLYALLAEAFDRHAADLPDLAGRFFREYPASPHAAKVRELTVKFRGVEQNRDRRQIKQIRITGGASLAEKGKRIAEFVAKHQTDLAADESKRMRRAAELARRFSELNSYTVELKRTAGLLKPYQQAVVLSIDDKPVREYLAPGHSREVNWNLNETKIQWSAGMPIRVLWRKSGTLWGFSNIATLRDDGPLALRSLGGRQSFTKFEGSWADSVDRAIVQFAIEGISDDDWRAVDVYLFPGDGW